MPNTLSDSLRDAYDIARRAKSGVEIARALIPRLRKVRVLNEGEAARMDPEALIQALRRARNALKGSIPGGRVDYEALRNKDAFAELSRLAPALQHLSPSDFTSDAMRTAFFINLYNVLAIHGVLALGIRESVMEIPSFFSVVRYRVGNHALSLDQIENGILRSNGRHPATGRKTLREGAEALGFAPSVVDPRVHAALVCASTSCPPVGFYEAERLDAQLELATANYINTEVAVADGVVTLPITFRYYAPDWGERSDIEAFLLKYAEADLAQSLTKALADGATFEYARYDWSLNVV